MVESASCRLANNYFCLKGHFTRAVRFCNMMQFQISILTFYVAISNYQAMELEQHALENVKSCWNIKTIFYLVTSGGQNFNLYLNIVYCFNTNLI